MQKKINYKDVEVVYSDVGEGPCILFLHGYLESGGVWEGFAELFRDRFRVLIMDLPGHGKSGTWGSIHSMEELAESLYALLEAEKIGKIFLVGHSMGGYVTMAFAEKYPESLMGYSLFHSTCFADSEEKKVNRDREISLVQCRKKRQIINVNIPKGFADDNVERLKSEVDRVRNLALGNPDNGIVAILNGMRQRPDRTHVLKDPQIPVLLIGGMKDNYIPKEVFEMLVDLAPHARVLRLKESGHMGFIEEPEAAARAILTMVE
ncbi:MAG: alpha/beta hydrolase [Bacteroidota bacterium]